MHETLSLLVHAASKVGKTSMAGTCPAPILLIDADAGGSKFLPLRKRPWDPTAEYPPAPDGTWDMCVVTVRSWQTVLSAYAWLNAGQHQFRSVVLDSITEVQRKCKDNLTGTESMRIQDWGALLTQMDAVICGFRDLTLHQTNPVQVVMLIAETRPHKTTGKFVPTMQGQISDSLPYRVDICGYLFAEPTVDANGQMTGSTRRLLIVPNDRFEAGERVQGRLGSVVDAPPGQLVPNVTDMLSRVYGLGMNGSTTYQPAEGVTQ